MTTAAHPRSPRGRRRRAVHMAVDGPRLLREAGQFFSSASAAFAEVVQNAYRARATRLEVDADPAARTVRFRDNGTGLASPEILFKLAASGWQRSDIVEPAGIGAFALFAMSESVEVASWTRAGEAGWRVRFEPARAIAGAAIAVEPAPPDGGGAGMEIRAHLRSTASFPAVDAVGSAAWRHYFPLHITIRAAGSGVVELPTPSSDATASIHTAVGTLTVSPRQTQRVGIGHVIWEHRRCGTFTLEELFGNVPVEEKAFAGHLAGLLRQYAIDWRVDAQSAVRPKLPDRETLIRDAAFTHAMQVLAATMLMACDQPRLIQFFTDATAGAPIVGVSALAKRVADHPAAATWRVLGAIPVDAFSPAVLLAPRGYVRVRQGAAPGDATPWCEDDGEGWNLRADDEATDVLVRPAFVSACPSGPLRAGIPVCAESAEAEARGIARLRLAFDTAQFVAPFGIVLATGLRAVDAAGRTLAPVDAFYESAWESLDAAACAAIGVTPDIVGRLSPDAEVFAIVNAPRTDRCAWALRDSTFGHVAAAICDARSGVSADDAPSLGDYVTREGDGWTIAWNDFVPACVRVLGAALGGTEAHFAARIAAEAQLDALIRTVSPYALRSAEGLLREAKRTGVSAGAITAIRNAVLAWRAADRARRYLTSGRT